MIPIDYLFRKKMSRAPSGRPIQMGFIRNRSHPYDRRQRDILHWSLCVSCVPTSFFSSHFVIENYQGLDNLSFAQEYKA